MPIATSPIAPQIAGALLKEVERADPEFGLKLGFQERNGKIIFMLKPRPPVRPSFAQKTHRFNYCLIDMYWKHMSPGQRRAWMLYYFDQKMRGLAVRGPRKGKTKKSRLNPAGDLSARSLFFRRGLMWNFLKYFEENLGAQLIVDEIVPDRGGLLINFHIAHRIDFQKVYEPDSSKVMRVM